MGLTARQRRVFDKDQSVGKSMKEATMPKIVEPTGHQQAKIDKRLAKKYPHMAKESWVKMLKKKVQKKLAKRRSSTGYKLAKAGVSEKKSKKMGY
ncbi:hypothetical protein LCGC14_0356350 [marine sediment metagenome]|uniref:Uncharacterized protein n=1 Tax=marine sediment metagenome TaxID=412755 RepID=A0A0F9WHN5_9ZZZZ